MDFPVIVPIRPSHTLFNPYFRDFLQSLEPTPTKKHQLVSSPRRIFTNDDQYSFLHAKLFSLQNHLVRDPWLAYSCYFVDDEWTIRNVRYNTSTGQLLAVTSVFKIPKPSTGDGDFNPTFSFVSEKWCVFSDGCGSLRIIDTGDRFRNDEWKGVFVETVLDPSVRFLIQDARLEVRDGARDIHCLLLSIKQCGDHGFEAVLDWIRLQKSAEGNNWTKLHLKQLESKSLPEYCAFEPKCNAILVSGNRKWEFVFDVEHPIVPKADDNPTTDELTDQAVKFRWNQGYDDVLIHFDIERDNENENENDVKIVCNGLSIDIQYRNRSLLDGELFYRIYNYVTTWNLVSVQSSRFARIVV